MHYYCYEKSINQYVLVRTYIKINNQVTTMQVVMRFVSRRNAHVLSINFVSSVFSSINLLIFNSNISLANYIHTIQKKKK